MKTIILSLFLLISLNLPRQASAQTVWYVDRDATGANTGRSWTDAWNYLDSSAWMGNQGVNWTLIGDGDTIYVSGGTDSTRYIPFPENFYNGIRRETSQGDILRTFNETVVVAPAWHEGHNGGVYFTPKNDGTYALLNISGVNNIKLTGFNIVETRSNSTTQDNGMVNVYGSDNTIENCYIYSRGITTGFYLYGERLTFRNNFFDYEENSLDNGLDAIGYGGAGGHITEGNIIITRNSSPTTTSHRDMLQYGNLNNPAPMVENIIRNNLIIIKGNSIGWNSIVYTSGLYADTSRWYIYNNIFVSTVTASALGALFMYQASNEAPYSEVPKTTWREDYFVWNNTIIVNDNGSGGSAPFTFGNHYQVDSLFILNNLVITDAPVNYMFGAAAFYYREYKREIDYNGWFEYGDLSGVFMPGNGFGAWTYAQWQADTATGGGGDIHSITGNSTAVTFANKYGENKADYLTETGRDLGINIAEAYPWLAAKFPDISNDILGNPRTGSWDIGALEFQGGGQSNNINLRSKVFLQGPFNTNSMNTNLSQNSLLPNIQPFNTAPWNYNGSESLSSGSGSSSSYVDWVLVELRSSSNPTQVVSRKAAILKNDGTLLNSDGSTGVPFSNVQEGSYYVAVLHRNHLAVMSANPVLLSANSQIYDFTNGMDKAYGTNPMANLGNGIFGMYAGDGNSNGGITIADRNEVWLPQNGTLGYLKGDFNLDGGVTIHDINLYWNINNGTMTQVP